MKNKYFGKNADDLFFSLWQKWSVDPCFCSHICRSTQSKETRSSQKKEQDGKGKEKIKKRKEHPKKRKKLGIVAWSAFLQTFFCSHCPSTCHQNTQQELNKKHNIIHDHIFKKGTAHTSGTKQTTQNKAQKTYQCPHS